MSFKYREVKYKTRIKSNKIYKNKILIVDSAEI